MNSFVIVPDGKMSLMEHSSG